MLTDPTRRNCVVGVVALAAIHEHLHTSWTGSQVPFVDLPHLAFNDLHG